VEGLEEREKVVRCCGFKGKGRGVRPTKGSKHGTEGSGEVIQTGEGCRVSRG
jgi:hypothetical protein